MGCHTWFGIPFDYSLDKAISDAKLSLLADIKFCRAAMYSDKIRKKYRYSKKEIQSDLKYHRIVLKKLTQGKIKEAILTWVTVQQNLM